MTKRKFLTMLATALAGIVTFKYFKPRFNSVAEKFRGELPYPRTTGTLATPEMTDLIALGEVLVDDRDLSDDEKESLRKHIADRTENDPGYYSLYEITAEWIRKESSENFAKRSREERLTFLANHNLLDYYVRRREWLLPWKRRERLIRGLAVPDLIAGYYRSAAGWAVVGYETFPGQCGDLSRYTRAEA